MMHIDMLSDRILFLQGYVIMKPMSDIVYLEKKDDRIELDIRKVLQISAEKEIKTDDIYNDYTA